MAEPRRTPTPKAVQDALKKTIEVNLARERALSDLGPIKGAWHSNGVIFSKSGNGTPFSNGIIFSKTGSVTLEQIDPLDGLDMVQGLSTLDQASFDAFTDRLLQIRAAKAAAPRAIEGH